MTSLHKSVATAFRQKDMSQVLTLGLIACLSATVGLLFNGYIVMVLVSNRQMRTANNLLLLHLALVGILSCVEVLGSTVPFALTTATTTTTTTNTSTTTADDTLCVAHGFVFTALLPIVVWTLCGLNCDRYAAIASPLHYSRLVRRKRIVLFVGLTWVLGVSLAVPPLFRVKPYTHQQDRALCLADFTNASYGPAYPFAYVSLAVVVPAFLICFCNVRILAIARHHRHRIVSAIYEVTVRAQATITHQRNPFYLTKYKGRCAVITILQLIGSLLALYGPYCGVMFWELLTGTACPPVWAAIAVLLVSFAAPLNGFVYGLKSPVLRKTFKHFLRKQLYTSEVRNEIQRRSSVSNRGWTTAAILRMPITSVISTRMAQGGVDVKSRSESPVLVRTDQARNALARSRSEGILVQSAVKCRINVPSPIHGNCRSVEVGFHLLNLSNSFDIQPLDHKSSYSLMVTGNSAERPLRTGSAEEPISTMKTGGGDDSLSSVVVVPDMPIKEINEKHLLTPVSNGHCKSQAMSLEKFLFQNKKNNIHFVREHSYAADRKFSLERLRNGHLKRSLRRVFSPPKLLAERGSI